MRQARATRRPTSFPCCTTARAGPPSTRQTRSSAVLPAAFSRLTLLNIRELRTHWGRAVASVAVVAVSAALLVAVLGVSGSITGSIDPLSGRLGGGGDPQGL